MKLEIASITFSPSKEGMKIEVKDEKSGLTFIEVNMSASEFCYALKGVIERPCEVEVRNLMDIGKKVETKFITFLISENVYDMRWDNIVEFYEEVNKHVPEGWERADLLQSTDSIVKKGNLYVCKMRVRRYIA